MMMLYMINHIIIGFLINLQVQGHRRYGLRQVVFASFFLRNTEWNFTKFAVLQIGSIQVLITGSVFPNTDRVENYYVPNTGVFLPVWYFFFGTPYGLN